MVNKNICEACEMLRTENVEPNESVVDAIVREMKEEIERKIFDE